MYKILVAEDSDAYSFLLQDLFEREFDMQFCRDGETALELLQSFQPDAMVINLMLPFKDGLTVLQESPFKPRAVLAITPFLSEYVTKAAEGAGVHYLTILPSPQSLRLRLLDLIATNVAPKEDLRMQTIVMLHTLNFKPHLDGYHQLCMAIPIYALNPSIRLSKELYPQIAEAFLLPDPRTVEHSIRKAIRAAWRRMQPEVWGKFFPLEGRDRSACPTNKELSSRLAEFIEL